MNFLWNCLQVCFIYIQIYIKKTIFIVILCRKIEIKKTFSFSFCINELPFSERSWTFVLFCPIEYHLFAFVFVLFSRKEVSFCVLVFSVQIFKTFPHSFTFQNANNYLNKSFLDF